MEKLMDGKDLSEDEVLELMKNELGAESKKKMEELIKQGHSPKDVMKMMMQTGKTQEEEARDTAETMKHIMTSKTKNIKMSQKELKEMLDERLDDESKAKMQEMLKKGVPLKDVLEHFAKQCDPPEEQLTEMEKKMQRMTEGKELSNYQIYELMKEQMDSESRKKMEEMVKNGCPLEEVIEHFMKKGKTKEQAQNEKSEELRQKMEGQKDLSQEEIIDMLKSELSSEDKFQLEKMLKNGCSMQEVIDHFLNRGNESDSEEKTEFQARMEEMLEGKNLNEDEILALMRSQVDDETKAEIKAMLEKGYTKQDVINHLMKTMKTTEEKERENAKKLMSLFDDQDMSEEEKISMLEKQLNNEDKAQMEEMLRRGCSIEEVIGHFMSRSESPDREKSNFAKNIEKLIEGKNLSVDDVLQLIEGLVSEKDQKKMEKMLAQGYSPDEIVEHFMDEAEKKSGTHSLAKKMEKLMDGKDLSEDEVLELMKNELGAESKKKMEELIKQGHSPKDVMKMMMQTGKTQEEEARDTAETMKHTMTSKKKNIKMSQKELKEMLDERLDDESKAKMQEMLKKGVPLKDVLEHFAKQCDPPEEQLTEMEKKIQKMTEGKELSNYQIYELMKEQMDSESRKKMEEMVKNGCPLEEVIEHFMKKGKTKEQAQNEKSEELRQKMEGQKDLSQEAIIDMLKSELSSEDKSQLEKMLKNGCSMQEVIDHFLNRGNESDSEEKTEFQARMEEMLEGKNLNEDEILALMRSQVDDDTKAEI